MMSRLSRTEQARPHSLLTLQKMSSKGPDGVNVTAGNIQEYLPTTALNYEKDFSVANSFPASRPKDGSVAATDTLENAKPPFGQPLLMSNLLTETCGKVQFGLDSRSSETAIPKDGETRENHCSGSAAAVAKQQTNGGLRSEVGLAGVTAQPTISSPNSETNEDTGGADDGAAVNTRPSVADRVLFDLMLDAADDPVKEVTFDPTVDYAARVAILDFSSRILCSQFEMLRSVNEQLQAQLTSAQNTAKGTVKSNNDEISLLEVTEPRNSVVPSTTKDMSGSSDQSPNPFPLPESASLRIPDSVQNKSRDNSLDEMDFMWGINFGSPITTGLVQDRAT